MSLAAVLAYELVELLKPVTNRVEIAGSIRRGKPNPTDIEITCIPVSVLALDLFGEGSAAVYDMNQWVRELADWELDRVQPRNGPRWKRLSHKRRRMCCDLFITRELFWGIIFTLRTGPKDFSQGLVTLARRKGYVVDGGQLWRVHRDGTRSAYPTPDEQSVFAALGVPYLPPNERSYRALHQLEH